VPRPSYYIDIRHDGLKKFRRISGPDRLVVEEKARVQREAWDRQWQRMLEAEARRLAHEQSALGKQAKKDLATQRTREAQEALTALERVLAHTLTVDDRVDWASLKSTAKFEQPVPVRPQSGELPREPRAEDPTYQPNLSLFDRLFASRRQRRLEVLRRAFEKAHEGWLARVRELERKHDDALAAYERALKGWEREREAFLASQTEHNEAVDQRRAAYKAADPAAIVEYCDLVLSTSSYPDWIPRDFELQYYPETKTLIVEYQLPAPEALPRVKEVRYVQSRDALEDVLLPDSAFLKMYDTLLYQITLRTVHELFEADTIDALDSVAFNGWVRSLDKVTGKEVTVCVLSLHARKREFLDINLAQVDPKACFKGLKGVGSSRLHGMTAIPPILQIDRFDSRFVASQTVVERLEGGTNIAAMGWEEFEHLIRELFEKEFSTSGGEVKVTQASRDGGVDAVAFDSDPIRGGKIVIQAKRYTNTVGVSAVRDLYGTLLNEGATKGILVTTSDYGPDAYEFAKGKPITLLNGANLLHLLEKHGHRARIDLQEAKKFLSEG
jgi:restriction system protein